MSKAAGYKINIQKSAPFPYTNNELSEREIKETSHLQPHPKINYLGKNLPKGRKDLTQKTFKTRMKEAEDNRGRWKDTLCS